MIPELSIPTLIVAALLLRFGQSFSLVMLWSAQRDYQPAKEWAIGSFLCALGLLSILFSTNLALVSLLANLLLIVGWLVFLIRASCERQAQNRP